MSERRVLLIDTDTHFQDLLARALAPYGVVVHVVDDGSDGLGQVADVDPEAIFISVELPDKVGYSTCNKAKKGVARKIPVVLTTATVPPSDLAQHRKLKVHADEYIDKRTTSSAEIVTKMDGLISLGPPVEDMPLEELPVEAEDIHFDEESHAGPPPHGFHARAGDTNVAPPNLVDPGIDAETDAVFAGLMDGDEPLGVVEQASEESSGVAFEEPKTSVRSQAQSHGRTPPLPPPLPAPPGSAGTTEPEPGQDSVDLGLDALSSSGHSLGAAAGARIAELEAEVVRLGREVEEARKAPTPPTAAAGFSREREFLNLREIINRKEKELLDLREEVDAKERVILGGKDKVRELDRKVRDHEEKLLEAEGNVVTANETIAALRDDKDKALEREKGLKARIDIAQAQLRKADEEFENLKRKTTAETTALQGELTTKRKELDAEKKAAADRHSAQEANHASALRKAGDEKLAQLAGLRRELEQDREEKLGAQKADLDGRAEKARLAAEATLAQHKGEAARTLGALRDEKDQALAKAEKDRKADLARAAEEQAEALADADTRRQQELREAEGRRVADLSIADEKRRTEVAEARELGQQALEELRANKDEEIARLRQEMNDGLAAGEQRRIRELAALDGKMKDELAAADDRRTRELQSSEERRMKELLAADSKRREDLAAAEERRNRETTELDDKHTRELGTLTQTHEEATEAARAAHVAEATELRGEIAKLEAALGQTRDRLKTTDADLAKTQGTLRDRESDLARAREDIADRDRRIDKHRGEIVDLERENASFQEQLLKAYQKIKSDEAIANKAKKAMAIALTLLDGEPKATGQPSPPAGNGEAPQP